MLASPLVPSAEEADGFRESHQGGGAQRRPLLWQISNVVLFVINIVSPTYKPLDLPVQYFNPAVYAFAIWAPIYIGEFIFVLWALFQCPGRSSEGTLSLIRGVSPGFCMAMIFQTAWGFFWDKRFFTRSLFWLTAVMLTGIPVSLNHAHAALCSKKVAPLVSALSTSEKCIVYLPLTVHFSWTTCAALVDWNIIVAMVTSSVTAKLAVMFGSLLIAVAAGVGITLRRGAVVYAATVCWALVAVGIGTMQDERIAAELGSHNSNIIGKVQLLVGVGVLVVSVAAYRRLPPPKQHGDAPRSARPVGGSRI